MTKLFSVILCCLISLPALAKPEIEQVIEMPVNGMLAVVDDKGAITLTSKNGRYVITGQIFDTWLTEYLDSGEQLKASAHRLPLKKMQVDVDALGALTLGNGPKVATIFTDPLCASCAQTFELAEALAATGEYQFKILIVPALGGKSIPFAKDIACDPNRERALKAVLSHAPASVEPVASCDTNKYLELLTTTKTLNVNSVPFLIAADGRVLRGHTSKLKAWIDGEI